MECSFPQLNITDSHSNNNGLETSQTKSNDSLSNSSDFPSNFCDNSSNPSGNSSNSNDSSSNSNDSSSNSNDSSSNSNDSSSNSNDSSSNSYDSSSNSNGSSSNDGNSSDSHLSENSTSFYNIDNLKCASLNVCGLKRRLNYPEFYTLINKFDIFCVNETKLDNSDIISVQGYTFMSQPRKQRYLRKSGGIGAFVKNDLFQHISVIETESDYILWFKLSKTLTHTDEDIFFGAVYLPPTESRFNTQDELDLFEVEILNMSVQHKYVFLTGDFNARTQTLEDFLDADDFLVRHFDFDVSMQEFYNASSLLSKFNMNRKRSSKDKKINNEGRLLLNICKSSNTFILNGRCGTDKDTGSYTFNDTSVIDYSIASSQFLKFVLDFEITKLDPLYTDNHSLLCTTFNFGNALKLSKQKQGKVKNRKPKWNSDKKADFIMNLDSQKISDAKLFLDQLRQNSNEVNQNMINQACTQISDIFLESAEKSFGRTNIVNTESSPSKQWFGPQCRSARRKYHIARRLTHRIPSNNNQEKLKQASKNYKRTMNLYLNKHVKNTQNRLRNLKTNNPKEFWKIINSLEKKEEDQNINLETLYDFFKGLNENNDVDENNNDINIDITDDDEILNSSITEAEILKCLKGLKSNKCSANDNITNEYLKNSSEQMMPIYISLFNLVLDTGIIPNSWLEGIIRPIFKRSGDPSEPENYRPITILSCFGKLFTAVLNLRLSNFLEYHNILEENQAGFRSGYSTTDHIFTLHALTEILKNKEKKLYCSFIDFSKAFDSVWRIGLWMKLLGNGVQGKMFRIIYNLYKDIKSCVSHAGEQSAFFQSHCGVRQGENLSPVLFSLFLNDLESYMQNMNCNGIGLNTPDGNIGDFLKILVLLYADDTVVFGTDAESFQQNLNVFYEYSQVWKLNINFRKTKIMIFGVRNTNNFQFRLGNNIIEICDEFKYLGVIFTKYRSFQKTIKHNTVQAKKALQLLYKRINNLHLPIDLQMHLFDHTIRPIPLYGCEIWGFQNTEMLEIFHNQFLRSIAKLRKSTPIYMLHAEFGREPIELQIKSRMIKYWISIVNNENPNKLTKLMYNIMVDETNKGKTFKWLEYIKNILIAVGKPDLINQHVINNPHATKSKITATLKDLIKQKWYADLNESSKGRTYSIFKENIALESYLITLPRRFYIPLIKFRTANYKLPMETGRWDDSSIEERKCRICNKNDVGDDFHYLLICPYFEYDRSQLLKRHFYIRPNILKYKELLTSNNTNILTNLSKFSNIIMNKFA